MKEHGESGGAPERRAAYAKLDEGLDGLEVRATFEGQAHHGHDQTSARSVRTVSHCGHTIEVVTTYEFKIDGKPVSGHFEVNDAGKVHCHDLPNYAFTSALELAKRLADLIGDDKLVDQLNAATEGGSGGGHDGHGGHGGHSGHDTGGEG